MQQAKRWRRTIVVSTMALALVASACSSDDDGGEAEPSDDMSSSDAMEPAGDPEPTTGFDGTTLTLGVITPTTGSVAVIGNPLTAGNQARVDAINAAGGIAGKYQIELVVEDSAYDAPTAVQKYTALKGEVAMFAQILGTPIVNALQGELATDGIMAGPASLDAFWVRNDNLVPVGAPYQIQAANALDWWVNQEGNADSVVCFAGHDDPYGEAGLEGLTHAATEMGVEIAATVTFAATDSAPEAQAPNVGRLAEAGCEFVFVTALPSTLGGLLGAAAGAEFAPTWVGNSPTWVNALAASPLAPYLGAYYNIMTDGPEWGDEAIPGMAEMIADVAEFAPEQDPDFYFTFGYAQMMAVEQILEAAAAAGSFEQSAIVEASKTVSLIDTGGIFGDYEWGAGADRNPPRTSRVFGIDPENAANGFLTAKTDGFVSDAAASFEFAQ